MSYESRGRGGGRYGNHGGYHREMHDAVCAACGAKTRVPFEPKGDRPVYCRDCYNKKRDGNLTDEQMLANKQAPVKE